mmetsp:Transcript_27198/g.76005  ORF Transcript_27198/g.76005 Transcript_27198/m.76005 type:complete len:209 (+) Transcript_27198:1207-1833(+)
MPKRLLTVLSRYGTGPRNCSLVRRPTRVQSTCGQPDAYLRNFLQERHYFPARMSFTSSSSSVSFVAHQRKNRGRAWRTSRGWTFFRPQSTSGNSRRTSGNRVWTTRPLTSSISSCATNRRRVCAPMTLCGTRSFGRSRSRQSRQSTCCGWHFIPVLGTSRLIGCALRRLPRYSASHEYSFRKRKQSRDHYEKAGQGGQGQAKRLRDAP